MQIISTPKIVHQGIDTLVIGVNSLDEIAYNTKFKPFVAQIRRAKEAAQTIKTFGEKIEKTNLGLNYGDFLVSSKSTGAYIGYVRNDDVFFNVSDADFKANSIYHIKLQFRSIYLLKYGHEYCMEQVKRFLFEILGANFQIKVLRLDLCTDVAGIKYTPVDFFNFRSLKKISNFGESIGKNDDDDLISSDDAVKTFTDINTITVNNFMRFNRFEGASFGKNPDMFRVYDKVKQVKNQNISELIFTKWALNGFIFDKDLCVFRHEVEFGRAEYKD